MTYVWNQDFPKFTDSKGVFITPEAFDKLDKIIPIKKLKKTYFFDEILTTTYKDKPKDKCVVFRTENEWYSRFVCVGYKGTYIRQKEHMCVYTFSNGCIQSIIVKIDDVFFVYSVTLEECKAYFNNIFLCHYANDRLVYFNDAIYNKLISKNKITMLPAKNKCLSFTRPGYWQTDSLTLAKQALDVHNLMHNTVCWLKTDLIHDALQNPVVDKPNIENVASPHTVNERIIEKVVERVVERVVYVEEKKNNDCVICMIQPRSVAFIPCGHNVSCDTCSKKCVKCPICRGKVKSVLKIYTC